MTRRRSRKGTKRGYRILALVPEGSIPPDTLDDLAEDEIPDWQMEFDVVSSLKRQGHEVECLDVKGELQPIREAIAARKPHVVFNMLEEFHGFVAFDVNLVAFLELLKVPYTGCNPRGLMIARDKALTKKILSYHRIRVPGFAVFPRNSRFRRVKRLNYPLIVKSLIEESSVGLAQASVVNTDAQLEQRVRFVHEQVGSDAIAEEYIEGRELNLGIIGNRRLTTFPVWELNLGNLPEGAPRFATARIKWDPDYREKYDIDSHPAEDLPEGAEERIARMGKRIYRLLGLSGYARLDLRLRDDGAIFVIEANPNPDLGEVEDFSAAAEAGGISYDDLIGRILRLARSYHSAWFQ